MLGPVYKPSAELCSLIGSLSPDLRVVLLGEGGFFVNGLRGAVRGLDNAKACCCGHQQREPAIEHVETQTP